MSWFRETMLKGEAKAEQFENWVKDGVSGGVDKTRGGVNEAVDRTNEFAENYQQSAESTLDRIPGYTGYKTKEQARDSDRLLRDEIARQLDQDATRVEALARTAANERNVSRVNELEAVVQGFRNVANIVRSLSYGYGGLFSDRPVDDAALAQLRLFDEGLLVKVTTLHTGVESIEAGDENATATISAQIADFKAGLDMRSSVIDHGRPAKASKPPKVSPAIEKAFDDGDKNESEPVELPGVSLGDAVSILGDDHLVEALIDVSTESSTERFIRLDNKPQMWLWLSTEPSHTPQQLLATELGGGIEWAESTGRAKISVPDERTRSGPAVIRSGKNSEGTSAVELDIDGAVQQFTASDVHPDDIETYRSK